MIFQLIYWYKSKYFGNSFTPLCYKRKRWSSCFCFTGSTKHISNLCRAKAEQKKWQMMTPFRAERNCLEFILIINYYNPWKKKFWKKAIWYQGVGVPTSLMLSKVIPAARHIRDPWFIYICWKFQNMMFFSQKMLVICLSS